MAPNQPSGGSETSEAVADVKAAAQQTDDPEFRRQLEELTPEQAEMFVRALRLAMRKRRLLLTGYLASIFALVIGMVWALYMYGATLGSGQFMGWVFLVPLSLAGCILFLFGRFTRKLR